MVSAELVGSVITGLRKSKGMSQEVLSGLAGLDRTHYSKIERGLRSPTIDTLFKIAHALDMPPHEIVMAIERALAGELAVL
ncbi:helix-turn-helix domain-containing protein [Acutalibacter muris]|jgi:transcriptional regulator with XRE-family HTH domain|uniref:helix-turn-helix domain-containing protein n=1 Tax=Acutalibacter muris TaxID=1796620 RepID=UPI0026F4027B|nr:helix-turn-helix transcriptional regulator [Acutalibacter muris]